MCDNKRVDVLYIYDYAGVQWTCPKCRHENVKVSDEMYDFSCDECGLELPCNPIEIENNSDTFYYDEENEEVY